MIVIAVSVANAEGRSFLWRPLVLVGEASYAIYLIHWFVLMSPPHRLISIFEPVAHPIPYSIAVVATVVLIGIAAHLAIEKPVMTALWFVVRRPLRSRLQEMPSATPGLVPIAPQQASREPAGTPY